LDSEAWAHWRELQDGIAAATGLSLITYNAQGRVLLSASACEPSHDHPICGLLQQQYGHLASCHAHCGKQVSSAAESQEQVTFTCFAGLQAFAVPVFRSSTDRVVLLGGKRFTSLDAIAKLRELADRLPGDLTPLLDELRRSRVTDPHVLALMAGLAEKIGRTFFDNISLRTRSELKLSRLLTLLSLCEEIRDEESLRQLYALVLNALGVLFGVRTAAVFALPPPTEGPAGAPAPSLMPVEVFGEQRDRFSRLQLNLTEGLFRRFFDEPKPTSCQVVFELLKSGLPDTVTSVHLFPLARGIPPQTVLALFNTPLTSDEISLVGNFCTHFSLTLEHQALQQRLNRHRTHVAALVSAIDRIGRTLEETQLCETIVSEATRLVGAEQGSLMMLDHAQRALVIKAITGINRKIVEQIRVIPGDGIAGKVFSTGTPLVVGDLETDSRVLGEKRPRYKTKAFASLPLKLDSRIIGVLNLADKTTGGGFAEEEIALISTIATCASVAIERAEFHQQSEALKRISITDALTGFLNRRYFHERLVEEIERSKRHATTLSLAIMDLDDFKLLNDTYGHQAGDEALKAVARCVHGSIRTIDVVARYGGEEFTLILPQTSKSEAQRIAQRICDEVAAMTISHPQLEGYEQLTISIGLAAYPDDANTPEGLVRCADTALYTAKDRGKNRVTAYGEP